MAIGFRGSNTATAINGGAVTVGLSGSIAGLAQNDVVIAGLCWGAVDDEDMSGAMVSAGWTSASTEIAGLDTFVANLRTWYKVMGAVPDANVQMNGVTGDVSLAAAAAVMAFSGVDTTTPLDVASTTATGGNSAVANPAAITWSSTGAWVVAIAGAAHDQSASTFGSGPTGYSGFVSAGVDETNADTVIGIAYEDTPAATEDPGTFAAAWTQTTHSWAAVTLALRPAINSQFISVIVGA